MIASIEHNGETFEVDLLAPIDISIEMQPSPESVSAWYLDALTIEPVKGGGFVGAVNQGGSVNFRNIAFNPHGHGTHTECLGHITPEVYNVNEHLKTFFFKAELISVLPEKIDGDDVITKSQIEKALINSVRSNANPEAIVIRTLPNDNSKINKHYSNTNPAFISEDAALAIRNRGIKHLLIDTPSVDKENDDGKLLAHHAFWNVPANPRFNCSITELIYVPEEVPDGTYLLNLSFASFNNDASPSKPVLYSIK